MARVKLDPARRSPSVGARDRPLPSDVFCKLQSRLAGIHSGSRGTSPQLHLCCSFAERLFPPRFQRSNPLEREQRAKCNTCQGLMRVELHRSELFFDRPNRPARAFLEALNARPVVVQWTDIAQLHHCVGAFLEPSKGKTLSTANVGSVRVDTTRPLGVEECACTSRMGNAGREQIYVVCA